MNYLKFSGQLPALWLVRLTIAFILPIYGGWYLLKYNAFAGKLILIILISVYLLLALYFWIYSRTRRYALHKGKLIFIRGVFFRRTTVIPLISAMLLIRVESPLSRVFGFCSIILRGGRLMLIMDGLTRRQVHSISTALE